VDVVYLCREGENEELRYSLRSLRNLPHDRVWIFGGAPEWLGGAELVSVDQHATKYRVTTAARRAACLHPGVSDPFVLMNDDFFIMEPVAEVPALCRGLVDDVVADYAARIEPSPYLDGMLETRDLLRRLGYEHPLSYELHVPLPVHKAAMLRALDVGAEAGIAVLHKRTLYGNLAGLGGSAIADVKLCRRRQQIPAGPWLSTLDATFADVLPALALRFPRPSPFEPPQPTRVYGVDPMSGRRYLERILPASPR
jgi:hypothetical protein